MTPKRRSGGLKNAAFHTSISTFLQRDYPPREYQSVKGKVGFEALVNTKSRAYERLFMAYLTPQAQEEKLLEHPELFAAPIVRNGREATVGYCPEVWETWT